MIACLNKDGKIPPDRKKVMLILIVWPSSLRQSSRR